MNSKIRVGVFASAVFTALILQVGGQEEPSRKPFFLPENATAAAYVLGRLSNQELIEAPRSEFVYVAVLQRKGLERKYRVEALDGIAKVRNTDSLTELLRAFAELDKKGEASEAVLRELSPILIQTNPNELKGKHAELEKFTAESQLPLTRQIAFAALVTADNDTNPAWTGTQSNPAHLIDLVRSVEFVRSPALRSAYYPRIEPLLHTSDAPELRQAAISVITTIPGHEAESFTTLAAFIQNGIESPTALASLQRIPKNLWPKESTKPLLDALMTDLRKTSVDQRSEPAFVNAVQFARDLASFLPSEEAAPIGKTLRGLGSTVFILHTIPEQMLYDQNLLVVEAGKPVEIILQNEDTMPHNLVITKPGAAEEVGNAAEKMSLTLDAQGRLYIPALPSVLHATIMVESGKRAKLAFTAPDEPADYPYLCSFPGHWRRMLGTLAVVKDVEAYFASHKAAPVKITDWKIGDFTADLSQANSARNLAHGKELFTKATCASCHKLAGEGNNFGPDLSDVFKRYNNDRAALLRQILEPSLVISNRYRNVRFALKDGEDVTGLVVKEDATTFVVQTGPSDSLIQAIPRATVQDQQPRELSLMPLGLLSTLSKDDIFDLLAWIESGASALPHEHKH